MSAEEWSAAAAVASALTALLTLYIAIAQQDTPFQQSLYQERWRAFNDFARAISAFEGSHADTRMDISLFVDNEEGLRKLSTNSIVDLSIPAHRMIAAKRVLTCELSGLMGPWSPEVRSTFAKVDRLAEERSRCTNLLGTRGQEFRHRLDWWAYVREKAKTDCRDYHLDNFSQPFQTAVQESFSAMSSALREEDQTMVPQSGDAITRFILQSSSRRTNTKL